MAILLAVFLGWWSWIYTFHWNSKKVWPGVGVAAGGTLGLIMWLVGATVNSNTYYGSTGAQVIGLFGFVVWLIALVGAFGLWIWAIIDAATTSEEDYAAYPGRA